MFQHRLLDSFAHLDMARADTIFGAELALGGRLHPESLAPVERVAILAEAFPPKVDGVSRSAYLTLRYLQHTGREVLVFAPDSAPRTVGPSHVIPLPSLGIPLAPETRVALPSLTIHAQLDEFRPDIVHLFSPALASVNGMLAARALGVPVVANYQTDLPMYANHYGFPLLSHPTRDWLRFIHNRCHLTLVPSSYTLNQLRAWGYHRLRQWPRGVDSQRFNPHRRTESWRLRLLNGRDTSSLLCLYVGRLANEKRIDLLLEVARTPGIALTIVGDGALRGDLETLFSGTGTHFMGYLYGDDLANAYASADVFVFTGPCETFGQVVQEALASGLPAVVINQGGVTDLVHDGETGYICPDNPEAFARATRLLRDDADLRQRLGKRARQYAKQRPWTAIMAQLEHHYSEALMLNNRFKRVNRTGRLNIPVAALLPRIPKGNS